MESNSNEKIIALLEQAIDLLASNDQEQWAGFLQNTKNNFSTDYFLRV